MVSPHAFLVIFLSITCSLPQPQLEQRIEDNKSDRDTFDEDQSFEQELGYDPSAFDKELPETSTNLPDSIFDLSGLSASMDDAIKETSPELTAPVPDQNTNTKSIKSDISSKSKDSKTNDLVQDFIADTSVSIDSPSGSKSKSKTKSKSFKMRKLRESKEPTDSKPIEPEQVEEVDVTNMVKMWENTTDLQLRHKKMVKLWEKERANLKKAQQLLLDQKEAFNIELDEIEDSHQKELDEVMADWEKELVAKDKTIETLEVSLAELKEERNSKIEGQQELNHLIATLEAEKAAVLESKALMTKDKQEQIANIRSEFEVERRSWETERKILTKNFERENYLQSENVQNTNALARSQSALQQKELENARLQGEIRWLKQDKEEIVNTNAMLKEENDSCQQQIESLNQIVADKNGEILEMKEEHIDVMNQERAKYSKLHIEYEKTKETMHQIAIKTPMTNGKRAQELGERVKELRDELLTKQTDLDRVISQRNEYRIRLTKMEEAMSIRSREERGISGVDSKGNSGLTRRGKRNMDFTQSVGRLPRKKYTKWKTINDSIGVFDRLGLEFAHVLRNKPWLRLLIVCYIIVLHLWCFLVLHFSLSSEQDDQHY